MTLVPVGEALEERRAGTAARTLDRLAGNVPDGEDVVAVHLVGGDAVGGGARGDASTGGHAGHRRPLAVEVVLADVDDRERPDGGEVQALVEVRLVYGPVTEERDRDRPITGELRRERGPGPGTD